MPMTRNSAPAPSGSQTTTTFQLGTYNAVTDTFTQSLDLNDQVTYFLKPGKGGSPNPKLEQKSTAIRADNVRNDGSLVVKDHLDNIVCTAAFTIKATTPQGVSDAWNAVMVLIKGQQRAKGGTLCLRFAWPQSTNYSYLDVQYAAVTTPPGSPLEIQAKAATGLVIALEGGYAWRWDRLTYQNLAWNPGFEAPSGPGVSVFSDAFANVNAYNPQQYRAAVLADAPLRYYEFDEISGTSAADLGSQNQAGTYTGTYTLGQAGALGGPDKAVLLDGSTAYVTMPTTSLPTGNGTITLEAMVNIAANPVTNNGTILSLGTSSASQSLTMVVTTAGKLMVSFFGQTPVTSAASLSFNAYHHCAATWDGTTLTLYLDGASVGTPVTPGAMNLTYGTATIGRNASSTNFFPGTIDKAAIYGTALSSARVGAHNTAAATGPATTAPANTFVDTVYANIPSGGTLLRYLRLGLGDSGTTALDISGNAQAGTTHGSPTTGVAGLVSGDTDTCYTLASASSQYIGVPTTGLPSVNNPAWMACLFKFASNPASNALLAWLGTNSTNQALEMFIDTSGKLNAAFFGGTAITSAAGLTTATTHFAMVTWNGTTLALYVDGTTVGTLTPGAANITLGTCSFGALGAGVSGFWSGQIDECMVGGGTVPTATNATNIYNAAHAGATGNLSNAVSFPAASRVSFGSPNWNSINTWAVRFRYTTSQVSNFYLHYTDANDYLLCSVQSGANGFKLQHDVTGSVTTIGQATVATQHEAWYWLQITQFPSTFTQFPSLTQGAPYVQAILSYDNNGAVGTAISTLAGQSASGSFAISGKPQIAPTGAALVISGLASGVGHALSSFGPGAWQFTPKQGSATCPAAGCWESVSTNTYPSGPVTSNYAARIDIGPAGSVDCQWYLYNGTTSNLAPTGLFALPVANTPATIQVQQQVLTSNVGSGCSTQLWLYEYDGSGNYLRSTQVTSLTGNTGVGTYQTLSGSLTTGTSTAYLGYAVRVFDSTTGSINGIVWLDNTLIWDQTATGTSSMAYCEMRFPQSPAQLLLSGIQGKIDAPTLTALGTYTASLPGGKAMQYWMGRRAKVNASAQLITPFANPASGLVPVLDTGSFGGVYMSGTVNGTALNGYALSQSASFILGSYYLYGREKTSQSGGNLANLSTQISSQVAISGGVSNADIALLAPVTNPFSATGSAQWTAVSHSQVNAPLGATSTTTDPVTLFQQIQPTFTDSTGGGSTWSMGATWLVPVDGGVLTGTLWNGSGNSFSVTSAWLWTYYDGLTVPAGGTPGLGFTADSATALSGATHIIMGNGSSAGTSMGLNPGADPFLNVSPALNTANANGVNQFVAAAMDTNSGAVGPIVVDLTYTPLSLSPR